MCALDHESHENSVPLAALHFWPSLGWQEAWCKFTTKMSPTLHCNSSPLLTHPLLHNNRNIVMGSARPFVLHCQTQDYMSCGTKLSLTIIVNTTPLPSQLTFWLTDILYAFLEWQTVHDMILYIFHIWAWSVCQKEELATIVKFFSVLGLQAAAALGWLLQPLPAQLSD